MNLTHIKAWDLNLLVVAAALYQHKNVSKAADQLGLSQSAVSHALTRLRDQFQDPLFVRTSRGMAPTEYARKIETEILGILQKAELLASRQEEFDPFLSTARVTVSTTDYFEVVVMPKLQEILYRDAPNLQISVRPTRGELPKRDLEDGSIDLAIAGFYRDLPEGFYQTKLFTDRFSSAVGRNHSLFKSLKLNLEQYQSARHALITLQGDFRDEAKASARNIVYGSYSFTSLAWTLQSSELLLTAPLRLLEAYAKFFPLRVWPCPVDKPAIDVRMIWHAQTHQDPLQVWMRRQIKEVCRALPDVRS